MQKPDVSQQLSLIEMPFLGPVGLTQVAERSILSGLTVCDAI